MFDTAGVVVVVVVVLLLCNRSVDALKKCDNNPHVVIAVARLFEKDRKVAKARKWFERAVALDSSLGDAWAYLYSFELKQAAISASTVASNGNGKASGKDEDEEESKMDTEESKSKDSNQIQETGPLLVERRCLAADPNRGELWCSVAKHTAYRRLDKITILKKVVEVILSHENPHLGVVGV